MDRIAAMNNSNSSNDSLSVGSIISAPETIIGSLPCRMEAVINQPLGHIASLYALGRLSLVTEDHSCIDAVLYGNS